MSGGGFANAFCPFSFDRCVRDGHRVREKCDRACLKTTLDQYLNAVVKHDTSAAPWFVGFRQTDNGVVVRPGTGAWQSITALGDIQRKFFDPVSGQ
jgi:hypothetical protein